MLNGVKIIDFSNYLPGPYATLRLAELGAEIIKVETLNGDPARSIGYKKDNTGVVFLAHNRYKKSIALNLKMEEGREIALRLISKADALLESFRPGVMGKLGLDYETIRQVNPAIVYCSITGYGDAGRLSTLGSHDLNYMGVSGLLAQLKDKSGQPVHPSITFADYFGGFAASERILSGLIAKFRTGKGSYHCISIADIIVSLLGNHLLLSTETDYPNGITELNGTIISYYIYETKDSRFVTLAALEPKFWRNFCIAINKPQWIEAHFSKADSNNSVFTQMVTLFTSRTLAEWIEFGQRVDCCLAPVLEVGEIDKFPPYVEHGTIFQSDDGLTKVKMHATYSRPEPMDPPKLGEHSFQILMQELGVSRKQLQEWKNRKIIK